MSMTCSFPGCERHPSKGDTILRISAKGVPFVGRCEKHYGGEDGEQLARSAAEAARAALASPAPELPLDLERVLRDPSIIVTQDQAVFEAVARWKNAPSDTASASPDPKEGT